MDAHQHWFSVSADLKYLGNGPDSARRSHPAIVCRWLPTSLDMSQDRDPRVLPAFLPEDVPHPVRRDRHPLPVCCALGHHQYRITPSRLPSPGEHLHHAVLPAVARRRLGKKSVICAACDGAHERKITAIASHHLDDEGALMRLGGGRDSVYGLCDAV